MPLSATMADIKAYQAQIEKNEISPEGMPPCTRCRMDSLFFKIHAYRERRFLLIVEMLVQAVFCALVRFRCPNCGKTYTYYPEFALPNKHYTRQTIESFSKTYVEDVSRTYEKAPMTADGVPVHPDNRKTMAGTTIYRWITILAQLFTSSNRDASANIDHDVRLHLQNTNDIAIPKKKYRSAERKHCLLLCRRYFNPQFCLKSGFHRDCNIM